MIINVLYQSFRGSVILNNLKRIKNLKNCNNLEKLNNMKKFEDLDNPS